jgi:hypothetical protein
MVFSLAFLLEGVQAQDEIAAEIQKTSSPPDIDGLGDDPVWAAATAHSTDEFFNVGGGEELDGDEDLQTTWKAVWDDTNLYVLIEVQDDELVYDESNSWEDDSVEIYIDAQNLDEPEYNPANVPGVPSYQFTAIAGQEPLDDTTSLFTWGINSYNNFLGGEGPFQYPQGEDVGGMVTDDDSGFYSFEVSFPWEALEETPANILARGEFGFGIAINDDDDGGGRNTQIMWASESPELWHNATVFPSVALSTEVIGGGVTGDFNDNGSLDGPDIDDLTAQSAGGTNPADYDLNADTLVNDADVNVWIKDLFNSWVGDADLNGVFDSSDLVAVLASGTYEADVASVWTTGDFNGDGRTNSTDLVAALADGGYELGPRAATAAVPEPSGIALLALGGLWMIRRKRRR